ncbi:MAG: hypothetical protein MUO72_18950 [Bacteroidales bacterium]|nr:hypothetical protein [Bacteroidales bacterium]
MNISEKYDKMTTGIISGLLAPILTALIVFLFSKGNPSLQTWLNRIADADIITHMISLCVLPNLLLFLLFNRFDMLRASRGVLGITIFWAVIVFAVKILR